MMLRALGTAVCLFAIALPVLFMHGCSSIEPPSKAKDDVPVAGVHTDSNAKQPVDNPDRRMKLTARKMVLNLPNNDPSPSKSARSKSKGNNQIVLSGISLHGSDASKQDAPGGAASADKTGVIQSHTQSQF